MAAPSEGLGYTDRSVSSLPDVLRNPTGYEDCIMGCHVGHANIAVTNVDEAIRFFSMTMPDFRVSHDSGDGPRMRQAMQIKVSISRHFKRTHFRETFTAVTGMLARSAALCLALLLAPALTHAAIASLNLANYTYTTTVALNNSVSNEVSGITWNWDTNTLFMVGDQAQAIAQYSLNGTYIDSMAMTGFSDGDAEGMTYIGSGQFVIAMETDFDAKLVDYVAGGTANGSAGGIPTVSIFSGTDGTYGFEGVSYDPSTAAYFFLEEKGSRTVGNSNPGSIYYTTLDFSPPSANADPNGTSIGNTTDIAGIQALSTVMLPGSADYNNLLIVSHEGHLVMEVDWSGNVLSSFSLSGAPDFQSEGVTIDDNGVIYVVDEGPTSGSFGGASCLGQNCPLLHIFSPDTDGDGIRDEQDNCILEPNGPLIPDAGGNSQRDTDGDGYGNVCDADLDNSGGVVNFGDLAAFKAAFGTADPHADFNGTGGVVNFGDLAIFKQLFGQSPGSPLLRTIIKEALIYSPNRS